MSVADFGSWWWPFRSNAPAACDPKKPQCDFYTSVNWEWQGSAAIPRDSGQVSAWTEAEDQLKATLKRICAESPRLRPVWAAALNRSEEVPARRLFDKIMRKPTWAARLAYMHTRGVDAFFEVEVRPNIYEERHERVLFLKQGGVSLPDRSMFATRGGLLRKHIADTLAACGFDAALADRAYEVEVRLAAAHLLPEQRRGAGTFNAVEVARLPQSPDFSWAEYVSAVCGRIQERVYVEHAPALEAAVAQLGEPYVAWLCCRCCAKEATGHVHRLHWEFYGAGILGMKEQKDAEKRAIEDICEVFPEEVSRAYVESQRPLHEANRRVAEGVVRSIQKSMRALMATSALLGDEARGACVEKIDQVVPLVGFPDAWPAEVERILDKALVKPSWQEMRVAATKARARYEMGLVGSPVDRAAWRAMFPFELNACFDPSENSIVLPAALLASAVFDLSSVERAMASAGMIVSHEMSHGFDDVGRNFSSKGVWGRWWPKRDTAEYARRCALLDEQLRRAKLNPELARGEAIADLVGMRVALGALPPRSDLRVFFETWARMWRIKLTPAQREYLDKVDPHATGWARTVLPLRNFEVFYDTYGIKEGDGMWLDPSERVSVF